MHAQSVKVPTGQRILRVDECVDGSTIALAAISSQLHAIYWVSPRGYAEDPIYAPTRERADGMFEARLMGAH